MYSNEFCREELFLTLKVGQLNNLHCSRFRKIKVVCCVLFRKLVWRKTLLSKWNSKAKVRTRMSSLFLRTTKAFDLRLFKDHFILRNTKSLSPLHMMMMALDDTLPTARRVWTSHTDKQSEQVLLTCERS